MKGKRSLADQADYPWFLPLVAVLLLVAWGIVALIEFVEILFIRDFSLVKPKGLPSERHHRIWTPF